MPRASRQKRGEITRHRVIDAAIQEFGMEGFERTTTRALVERAGTNLVAIHYHFGSKEAVYRAAAEHIAASIRERSEPVLQRARDVAARPRATRKEIVEAVCDVFDGFTAMALAGGQPECWRLFMMREQVEPTQTGAFEVIFAALQPYFATMFALISRLIGRPGTDPEVRLLATMIFGQVSVFRTNRTAALRLLGWQQFGPDELRQIRRIGRKHIVRLLDVPPPRKSPARPTRVK